MEKRMLSKLNIMLLFSSFLMLVFSCCIFVGCDNINAHNTKIFVENYENETIVVNVGEFNYDNYDVVARFEDGSIKKTKLKKEMLSELEQMYFLRVGEYDLTINAFNTTGTMKVKVVRKDFSSVKFESKTVVYDKDLHSISVQGDIPAGTTISYVPSNTFSAVGIYNITAVLTNQNFATTSLTATLTIEKAQYDMSNVEFNSKTFDYDGMTKSITISGELPDGVDVSYSINGRKGNSVTNAGVYEVIANFSIANSNYMEIESKKATLTINKGCYNTSGVKLEPASFNYDGSVKSIVLQGNYPNALKLSYKIKRIKDSFGNDVDENFYAGNSAIDAGTYMVVANLDSNDLNYEDITPFTGELKIEKASFSLENVEMKTAYFDYDGHAHYLGISGKATYAENHKYSNITVSYTIDGVEGNSAVNAGKHIVVATIYQDNPNYENSFTISEYLIIGKVQYNFDLSLNDKTVTYTGDTIALDYQGQMPNEFSYYYRIQKIKDADGNDIQDVILDGNQAIEVGTYIVSLHLVSLSPNYENPEPLSALLTIEGVN